MAAKYDCVYYWAGGEWNKALINYKTPYSSEPARDLEETRRYIQRQGYHAVYGNSRIGPPEGPPVK
jgi:hypothetical protein